MVKYDFSGKKVLITGSSRGVGRAAAQLFARSGAKVGVHFHQNDVAARECLDSLEGDGHRLLQADMAEPQAVRTMVRQAHQALGGLDILVNNAGVFLQHPLDMPFENWLSIWQQTINTNLTGAAVAAYTAAELMREQGSGKIINVGSRGAFRGEALQVGYGAAKSGLHSLSQSLAQALAGSGITVHALAPGFIETAMVRTHLQGEAGEAVKRQSPLNRVAKTEEIANAIAWLCCPEAEYTTGCILDMNGASYLRN